MALTAKERTQVREAMELVIREAKADGQEKWKIILQGIGTFSVQRRKERLARNLQTGENVLVPAKAVLKFKPSGEL